MAMAAEQPGAIILSDDLEIRGRGYPHKLSQQMTFPGASNADAIKRFEELMAPIESSIELLRSVVDRVEALWVTTRNPGVVTLTYPDGRFEPHDGRGLNSSRLRDGA